jgi:hypothetical protein
MRNTEKVRRSAAPNLLVQFPLAELTLQLAVDPSKSRRSIPARADGKSRRLIPTTRSTVTASTTTMVARPGRAHRWILGLSVRQGHVDGAHRSGRSTVRGRQQRWPTVFQGSKKALTANGGDGRHLQHQRGEGQSQLVKKGLEEALTEDGSRRQRQLESGGSVDSESGGSCGAPVGWSRREARGGGVSAACTGRKRKKEKGGGVRWHPSKAA